MRVFMREKLFSFINSPKLLIVLFVYSVIITLVSGLSLIKWNYWKNKFAGYKEQNNSKIYNLSITPLPSPLTKSPPATCINESSTLFTGNENDKEFAACLEDGKYNVYRETLDGYYPMVEETGRLDLDKQIIISYEDYSGQVPKKDLGSRVFMVDKTGKKFNVLLDPLDIPNKEDWISGVQYNVIYAVYGNETWSLSPDKNILLLTVSSCWGCDASYHLYAYNFFSKELKYIGGLYRDGQFYIEWIDINTLRWRGGRWRERTANDTEEGHFPAIQEDLGYKITSL